VDFLGGIETLMVAGSESRGARLLVKTGEFNELIVENTQVLAKTLIFP